MGLFGKNSRVRGYEKSGSKGKPRRRYGKGKALSDPEKYKPSTDAQARREALRQDAMGAAA